MLKYRINSCLVLTVVGILVLAVLFYLVVEKGGEFLRRCADLYWPRTDENGNKKTAPALESAQGAGVWYIWEVFDAETP